MVRKMIVEIGGSRFTAVLENNEAADALTEMMKENLVTIQMRDYAGFEKWERWDLIFRRATVR